MEEMKNQTDDMVRLQTLNQQLQEFQEQESISSQQLEHASLALSMIEELQHAKPGQELLIPIGNGIFFTVQATDVKTVKTAVGSGVVVDKSSQEAKEFVEQQMKQISDFHKKITSAYQKTVQEAVALQEKIESGQQ